MPRRNAAHNASRNNAALGRSVLVIGGTELEGARDAEDAEDVPPCGLGDDDLIAYDAEMEEGDALKYRDEVDLTGAEVDEFDGGEDEDEDAFTIPLLMNTASARSPPFVHPEIRVDK